MRPTAVLCIPLLLGCAESAVVAIEKPPALGSIEFALLGPEGSDGSRVAVTIQQDTTVQAADAPLGARVSFDSLEQGWWEIDVAPPGNLEVMPSSPTRIYLHEGEDATATLTLVVPHTGEFGVTGHATITAVVARDGTPLNDIMVIAKGPEGSSSYSQPSGRTNTAGRFELDFKRFGSETDNDITVRLLIYHGGGVVSISIPVELSVPPAAAIVNDVGVVAIE